MVEANCPPASSRKLRTASGPDWNAAVTRRVVAVLTLPPRARRTGACPRGPPAARSTRTYVATGRMLTLSCGTPRPGRPSLFRKTGAQFSTDGRSRHLKIGNLGADCPRPSAYVCLRQRGQRELGEIDMVSIALATLDLATHDDAQPTFPAVCLENRTVLSYG